MQVNITMPAGAALEAGRFVKLDAGKAVYAGAGEEFVGVTVDAAATDEAVTVCTLGAVKVDASVALTRGAFVEAAADGKARVHATGEKAGVVKEDAPAPSGGKDAKAEIVLR